MEFICAEEKQWKEIKTIYMEAFPKREKTIFCTAAFRKNEKSGCYGSNRR